MELKNRTIQRISHYLFQSYSFDLRALAFMRIGISIILLLDLLIRSLSIKAFFTDEGILPISILKQYHWNDFYFSFHALHGDLWLQILLFILNTVSVFLLLIGYRTRMLTFICWVFLVSLQNRNPFILQSGDDLLRMTLLFSIFLPWGNRYSVSDTARLPTNYLSFSSIGYLLLVSSVYFFSALLKTSPEWHSEGTAIYYALSLDQIRLPLGTLIYPYPSLLKSLTFIVYHIELIAPLILIFPFPKKFKLVGIILIALLHIGISVTVYVGLFFLIGLITLLGLMPGITMNWVEQKFKLNQQSNKEMPTPYSSSFTFDIINLAKNSFIGMIICYCLLLNLSSLKSFPYGLSSKVVAFGSILRLEQNWGMFSPYILKDDGYYVFSGLDKQNKPIDIKHQLNKVSFLKPIPLVSEFESDRWRKYSENYAFKNNNYMRPYYCHYLLKKWNLENPGNKISELTIYFMKEISLPDYKTKPIEKNVVCNCHINELK